MHDCLRALLGEDTLDERAVRDGSFVERDLLRHGAPHAVGQIVDHRDRPARILEREHGVAADISGAAGDEDWDFAHAFALAKARTEFQPQDARAMQAKLRRKWNDRPTPGIWSTHSVLRNLK